MSTFEVPAGLEQRALQLVENSGDSWAERAEADRQWIAIYEELRRLPNVPWLVLQSAVDAQRFVRGEMSRAVLYARSDAASIEAGESSA